MIGMGVPSSEFNEIKGLKGSRRRRWGSIFDQHSHLNRGVRATESLLLMSATDGFFRSWRTAHMLVVLSEDSFVDSNTISGRELRATAEAARMFGCRVAKMTTIGWTYFVRCGSKPPFRRSARHSRFTLTSRQLGARTALRSRDFVPWRFLDAGQVSVPSLLVAGVQNPTYYGKWPAPASMASRGPYSPRR